MKVQIPGTPQMLGNTPEEILEGLMELGFMDPPSASPRKYVDALEPASWRPVSTCELDRDGDLADRAEAVIYALASSWASWTCWKTDGSAHWPLGHGALTAARRSGGHGLFWCRSCRLGGRCRRARPDGAPARRMEPGGATAKTAQTDVCFVGGAGGVGNAATYCIWPTCIWAGNRIFSVRWRRSGSGSGTACCGGPSISCWRSSRWTW